MANERKRPKKRQRLRVDGMDPDEVRELQYFCAQYWRKKREADALLTLRVSTPPPVTLKNGEGMFPPRGGGRGGDPVADAARRREKYLRDVAMIDRAAKAAAARFAPPGEHRVRAALIECVTGRESAVWASGRCHMSLRTFYRMRWVFFRNLRATRLEDKAGKGGA